MSDLNIYIIITALSGLVLLSYAFSIISAKTRIPTVLMLLILGVGIREALIHYNAYVNIPLDVIQFFGVLGLILILLEAGLELNMSSKKLPLVKRAAASSIFVLALSFIGIGGLVHLLLEESWRVSFIYAIPLSVISSTIVASSIQYLGEEKREFLTYESSFSDIFGILLFNFLIASEAFSVGLLAFDVFSIILAIAISLLVSVALIFLLTRVNVNIKAFLIFAVLLIIYSLGHILQLPTLLTVLIFGLIINNWHGKHLPKLYKRLGANDFTSVADNVKSVTAESAFLIRTLFFTLFGYMIDIHTLINTKVLLVGTAIVLMIFLVRYLYLRLFAHENIFPELFFAPRGLVTIVLYYSIPTGLAINGFDDGILFYVIMLTMLVMMLGSIWFTPRESTREAEEEQNNWHSVLSRHLHG